MTLQNEKPELEVRKTELLKQEEELKIQLAKLEESLLEVSYWLCLPLSLCSFCCCCFFYVCLVNITLFSCSLIVFHSEYNGKKW